MSSARVNAQVNYIPTPVPEPEEEPEPVVEEVVEETTEVIETNPIEVEEVIEEIVEPVDDGVIIVEEEVYEITEVTSPHPVPTAELDRERSSLRRSEVREAATGPLPDPSKSLAWAAEDLPRRPMR